jgi:DNA polymerase IV
MELPINHNEPTIMHLDLNSCFASIEQQANPLIRNKPVVVAAYVTPNGCVIAPSVEAKQVGIKVGMTVRDAKLLYKDVIVLPPDPPKYRDVHMKLKTVLKNYSPVVIPVSIDEAVINFAGTQGLKRGLTDIAREIKARVKIDIGEWIRCSVGISTNRFLAKLGASLHKPDGLDTITHENLREVLADVKLTDLCGINTHFEARLNAHGIFTPLEFLDSSVQVLQKQVFKSIMGHRWYLKLRGWEVDDVELKRKSYGQSYALPKYTADPKELSDLLMKLTEKMGRRLRRAGYKAYGVHVSCLYSDYTYWHHGQAYQVALYATQELFAKAQLILNRRPGHKKVTHLAVSCYNLEKGNREQLQLFAESSDKLHKIADAADKINDKYGEYIITPARMMGMTDRVIDRVAFGGVRDLEDIYLL